MNKTHSLVYVLRSAPYQYQIKNYDLYDSFNLVAVKKIDPPINETSSFRENLKHNLPKRLGTVYCSPTLRSYMTAQLITKHPIKNMLLSEINYSMGNFISKEEFFHNNIPDVTKARKRFVDALVTNNLHESYENVVTRITLLFDLLNKSNENQAVISHGFFMKVLESVVIDPSVITKPKLLLDYFDGNTQTYSFSEGFILKREEKGYKFLRHI